MSAAYVRSYYGVAWKRGDRITVDGRSGTIVSFPDQYLGVRFDDCPKITGRVHPTWRVEREGSYCGRGPCCLENGHEGRCTR